MGVFLQTLALALSLDAPPENSPAWIGNRHPDAPPLWVRADLAIDARGELRDVIGSHAAERLRAERSLGPCKVYSSQPILEHFKDTSTAEALLANTERIVTGRIVSTADGFFLGTPGQLLTIDAGPDSVYLFFPSAEIQTPLGSYCSIPVGTDARPRWGDRVVIFSMLRPLDTEGRIFQAEPGRELVIESGRRLYLPRALRNDKRFARATSVDDVMRVLDEIRTH